MTHVLDRFVGWLLSKDTQSQATPASARTFRRHTTWCWNVTPSLPSTGQIYHQIQLDGLYLSSRWCILIALGDGHVIDWQWCDKEKTASWQALLERIAPPQLVILDGGPGAAAALAHLWPDTPVQRCLVHLQRGVRRQITLRPKTAAGRELRRLSLALTKITTPEQAATWMTALNTWHTRHKDLLTERTYATDTTTPRAWWYTHERLRKAYNSLATPLKKNTVFTYLDPTLTGFTPEATTNRIEGGVNAQIRLLLKHHRGLSTHHQRRAIEWLLTSYADPQPTPRTFLTPEHYTPTPTTPPPTPEHVGPAAYDNNFSWEDGNGLQQGWAGRPH